MDPKLTDCKYFMLCSCTKGDSCAFRHSEAALTNPVICRNWKNNFGCTNKRCGFRHPPNLKGGAPSERDRSQIPCYWLTQPGGCTKGDSCLYNHDVGNDTYKSDSQVKTVAKEDSIPKVTITQKPKKSTDPIKSVTVTGLSQVTGDTTPSTTIRLSTSPSEPGKIKLPKSLSSGNHGFMNAIKQIAPAGTVQTKNAGATNATTRKADAKITITTGNRNPILKTPNTEAKVVKKATEVKKPMEVKKNQAKKPAVVNATAVRKALLAGAKKNESDAPAKKPRFGVKSFSELQASAPPANSEANTASAAKKRPLAEAQSPAGKRQKVEDAPVSTQSVKATVPPPATEAKEEEDEEEIEVYYVEEGDDEFTFDGDLDNVDIQYEEYDDDEFTGELDNEITAIPAVPY